MTRIYDNPAPPPPEAPRTRALVVGAGRYDQAKTGSDRRPILADLSSVAFSVHAFTRRLLVDWRNDLAAPLASVDLLLSSADEPGACRWTSLGVPGEVADGTEIETPTLANLRRAMVAALQGTTHADHLIVYFCGHGFWKGAQYFFLSDFGAAPFGSWEGVVNLDALKSGLRTLPPRTQWIFQDCCSDLPQAAFDLIATEIGDRIITTSIGSVIASNALGPLFQFGAISSSPGKQAFGEIGKPTRFAEMLIEAIDGAGAINRPNGNWWVSNRGIDRAMETFAQRHIDLADPNFYKYSRTVGTDAPGTMLLRRVTAEPKSCFIAVASPAHALKRARARITMSPSGQVILDTAEVGRNRLRQELPPRKDFDREVVFENGSRRTSTIFSDLPIAEPEEARFEADGPGS